MRRCGRPGKATRGGEVGRGAGVTGRGSATDTRKPQGSGPPAGWTRSARLLPAGCCVRPAPVLTVARLPVAGVQGLSSSAMRSAAATAAALSRRQKRRNSSDSSSSEDSESKASSPSRGVATSRGVRRPPFTELGRAGKGLLAACRRGTLDATRPLNGRLAARSASSKCGAGVLSSAATRPGVTSSLGVSAAPAAAGSSAGLEGPAGPRSSQCELGPTPAPRSQSAQ